MTEENTLAVPSDVQAILNASTPKFGDDTFDIVASGNVKYLPRIQLGGAQAKIVQTGQLNIGRYGLIKGQKVIKLGNNVPAFAISFRPKAMRFGQDVMSFYDPSTPEFQQCVEEAGEKDSECSYGPEFLVYLPEHKTYATYFANSATARNRSADLRNFLKSAVKFKSELVTNKKKQSWWAPMFEQDSAPPAMTLDPAELQKVIQEFENPKSTEVEAVDEKTEAVER